MNAIRIFISHSSEDQHLAGRLAHLLCISLRLQPELVRCSSVDGYRLPAGIEVNKRLREEVCDADAFICILSNASLSSMYVLFELGARWGCGRYLVPLVTPGTRLSELRGPLSGLNILRADNPAQLSQLISDVGSIICVQSAPKEAYQALIDEVVNTRWGDPFGLPSDKYRFRRADACDINQIHQLAVEIYGPTRYAFTKDRLREWLQINPKCFFVMVSRENIVGYIDAFPISDEHYDHLLAAKDERQITPQGVHAAGPESSFYIASIVVAPDHRGNVLRFIEKALRFYGKAYPNKAWKRICALAYTANGVKWVERKGMLRVRNTEMWHIDRQNLSTLREGNRAFWRPLLC